MSRAQETDYMQGMNFHVTSADEDFLAFREGGAELLGGVASFKSVTIPDISVETVEYREGTFTWTRKQPGIPTVTNVSMLQGVTRRNTLMFDIMMRILNGEEYRTDLVVHHFHRDEPKVGSGAVNVAGRRYLLRECYSERAKPAGDLDAMSGEVSIAEIDFVVEEIGLITA